MTRQSQQRHSSVCHRHPTSKPTSGLCATCLRERIEALSSDQIPELRRCCDAEEEDDDDEGIASRSQETEDGVQGEKKKKKTMKELIDLESTTHRTKKNDVVTVLTRTLKKLLSLKLQMMNGNNQETGLSRRRRRSCDVDPRQGRVSLEEARASWDRCLTGKISLSAVTEEDAKASPEKELDHPGGTAQTRDYYFGSGRRRSFDRSSTRHGSVEVDELKAKLSSSEGVGLFHRATKLLVTERELKDSDWYSIKPESLELASSRGVGEVKKTVKKWHKGWNLWGLIQRKAADTAVKKEIKTDAMEGPFVETLLKLRKVARGESNVSERLMRSYSVSAARKSRDDGTFHGGSIVNGFQGGRSSCDGLFHGSVTGVETGRRRIRRSSCEERFFHGIEGKGDHILQRDAKLESYSPDNLRNSMVRFYLTPFMSQTTSNSGRSRLIH